MSAEGVVHSRPVHGVREIDVEVCNHRLALTGQVRRRRKIRLLGVLQLTDQGLLGSASKARVVLNCSLIHHKRKREAGMLLSLGHDQLCGLINRIIRAIPVDDHTVDTAADHIRDLIVNLHEIRRTVADIHMIWRPEP